MANEKVLLPSQTGDRYWIEVAAPKAVWSKNSGKWLLFVSTARVDSVWRTIRMETIEGRLGVAAKVATAMNNPISSNSRVKLICIYTYNFEDVFDMKRVRERLRALGFMRKIPYKSDAATDAGLYAQNGDKKVSLYYE